MEMTLVNLAVINFLFDAWQHLQRQHGGTLWRARKPRGEELTLFVLSLSQFKAATLSASLSLLLSSPRPCFFPYFLCSGYANTLLLLLPEVCQTS